MDFPPGCSFQRYRGWPASLGDSDVHTKSISNKKSAEQLVCREFPREKIMLFISSSFEVSLAGGLQVGGSGKEG